MLVASKRTKHLHNLPTSITIGNAQIPFKQSLKNLGFTLDCHLTMNAHVSNIARTCYFELRRLASICRFLTSTATATLVSDFALSTIDYCNSLLFGSTHDVTSHLQRKQNYAARVILRLRKSSSITMHLESLHWLFFVLISSLKSLVLLLLRKKEDERRRASVSGKNWIMVFLHNSELQDTLLNLQWQNLYVESVQLQKKMKMKRTIHLTINMEAKCVFQG